MYKQCRTEQSAARQRQLTEGLLEAMLQQDYEEITVSSLCQRMDIPRKSFYRYFSSKEGALHALIDQVLLDFESFSENGTGKTGTIQEEMERLFAYWLHQRRFLDALARSGLSGTLVYRAISHSVSERIGASRFRNEQEQHARSYITLFAVTGFLSTVLQWHHDGYPQSVKQMSAIAAGMMGSPIAQYFIEP